MHLLDIIGDQLTLGVKEFPVRAFWLDTDSYQSSWVVRRWSPIVVAVGLETLSDTTMEDEPPLDTVQCLSCKRHKPYAYFGRDSRNKERHYCKSYCNECDAEYQAKYMAWKRAGKPCKLDDFAYEWKPRRAAA